MLSRLPLFVLLLPAAVGAAAEPVQFNRDIRPILSENCFYCHGQDPKHREADLRLDGREEALRDLGGYAAIVPGQPEKSEVLARLRSHNKDDVMPPPKTNKHITPAQLALVERWIAEGAAYQKHWAYIPPEKAALPEVRHMEWARQPMDRFVLARLEKEGLAPSPEAQPETWLRRASFDLIGLPPSSQELDAFAAEVAAHGEDAYAAAADRLLASPHFGERQATDWLDAARYADTHGFNNDALRTMWRWRDWVIDAFNSNLPYDRFITEQLAGDLLPQPSLEQRIATGFSRNHVISSEGGIIDEEYRVAYVADRVRTTCTAWLGLTMECARCHDHKFDPITQRAFYEFSAFFNNVPEHGEDGRVANAVPMIPAPTPAQQAELAQQRGALDALDAKLSVAGSEQDRAMIEARTALARTETGSDGGRALLPEATAADGIVGNGPRLAADQPASKIPAKTLDFSGKDGETIALWLKPEAENPRDVALLSAIDYSGSTADSNYGKGREVRLIDGEIEWRMSARFPVYAMIVRSVGAAIRAGEWRQVAVSVGEGKSAATVRMFVDGVEVATLARYDGFMGDAPVRDFLVGADNAPGSARWRGELDELRLFPHLLSRAEVRARFDSEALPLALTAPAEGRAPQSLSAARQADDAPTRDLFAQRAELWEKHLALQRSLPTAMVMQEMPEPRPAFILTRGNYDAHGERVDPGVPETLIAPWPAGAPRNRLGLAQWFTQPRHPLTARVVVNRFWSQLFGVGLVKTLEDFGSQSEWPSHPDVLDWLARDFVDGGWNVKGLFKSLVLSATYRQSSAVTPELVARDPENRLLARGPRVRLPAEMIRDQALAISGLLAPGIGGPSVFPYQPARLYEGVVVGADYPGSRWVQSTGDDLYRRSLYTFWKRTVTHPAMLTFDAPDREFCTVRRSPTNTPLQALLLWNEPGYLESARQLATRMLREGGADDHARVAFAFRLATGRRPDERETQVLTRTLEKLRADFSADAKGAAEFVKVGASPVDATLPVAELAAATGVASMILNLDETITKN